MGKRLISMITARFKRFLIVFSLLINVGLMLYLYRLFLIAYTSPSKAVTFYINAYGEANNELVMMTGAAILGFSGAIYLLTLIRKKWKR